MRTATALLAASFLALAGLVGCSVGTGPHEGVDFHVGVGASAHSGSAEMTSCPHSTPACAACRAKAEERERRGRLAGGLSVEVTPGGEEAPPPNTSFNVDNPPPTPAGKRAEPEKPLKRVTITVAHTAGHSEEDQEDEATWTELKRMMKQFGFELVLKRDGGKSLIKPPEKVCTHGVCVLTDMESGEWQCRFTDLLAVPFPNDPRAVEATNRYDFILVITDYVRAQGEFRIGFDFGSGIAIAAAKSDGQWKGGPITPGTHQGAFYQKESAHGRALLLFHEIIHHITGGTSEHEAGGVMAKYGANTDLYVGPYYAEELEKSGGKSVDELKKAGLWKDVPTK